MSFFQAIQTTKICFTIFQKEKTIFQPIKKRSSKSRTIEIFPKVLTHSFGQKMALFQCLFFRQYRPGKFVLQYSGKKTPFQPIKTTRLKSRKIEIFAKGLTHRFGQKMAIYPCLFFSYIGQENVVANLLEKKNAFLPYKNNTFKKSKNNPWFWSKNGHFSTSFFRKYTPGKCVLQSSRTKKNAFQAYEKRKFTKSKN